MKMNKKIITFSFMFILALGVGTAGLVNYLSNTSEYSDYVDNPVVVLEVSGFDDDVRGGETQILSAGLENEANAQIKGRVQVVISSEDISLEDFNTLTASITEHVPGIADWNSGDVDMTIEGGFIESIVDSGDELTFITTERTFEIGETWDANISLGYKANVVGDYNVEVTVIPTA